MLIRTSGYAVAALVCAFLGCNLAAIIFALLALRHIRFSDNITGKGIAKAGLIIGCIGLAFELWIIGCFTYSIATNGWDATKAALDAYDYYATTAMNDMFRASKDLFIALLG